MGKYYRTSSATPLDYMYKLDAPLMERAVKAQEGFIDTTLAEKDWLAAKSQFKYHQKDAEAASKLIQDYTGKTEAIAQAILKDPLNWQKQQGNIAALRKRLSEDYSSGAISKYEGNYAQKVANEAAIDKQVELYNKTGGRDKEGNAVGIAPENAARYKEYWEDQFKGTNYDANNPTAYNRYAANVAMGDMNIKKELSDGLAQLKADGKLETTTNFLGQEEYFNKVTHKSELLTPQRVLQLVMENYGGNQKLQNYIRERSNVGLLSNMMYEQDTVNPVTGKIHKAGEIISPYDIKVLGKGGLSPEQKNKINEFQATINSTKDAKKKKEMQDILNAQIEALEDEEHIVWNPQSGLAPIVKGLVDQTTYKKTQDIQELKGGTNWGTRFKEAGQNNRFFAGLNYKKEQDKLDNAFRDKKFDADEAERKADNARADKALEWKMLYPPGTKGVTGPKGAAGPVKKEEPKYTAPDVTSVDNTATNSFAGKVVKDVNNKDVPKYSAAGVAAELGRAKGKLADIDARIARNNQIIKNKPSSMAVAAAEQENAELKLQRPRVETDITMNRDLMAKAVSVVRNNKGTSEIPVSDEDLRLHDEFANDYNGTKFQEHIKEVEKKYPKIIGDAGMRDVITREEAELAQLRQKVKDVEKSSGTTIDPHHHPIKKRIAYLENSIYTIKQNIAKQGSTNGLIDSPQVAAERLKLKKYKEAEARITKATTSVMDGINKQFIHTNAIRPTAQGSSEIWDMFSRNPNNSELLDTDGKKIDNISDDKGFSSGGDFSTGLLDYIKDNNVKVHVKRVAPATNIGNGNGVLEVQFEDENGGLSDKPHYISLSPQLTEEIATKYKDDKNPEIAAIANEMNDPVALEIRRQVMQPKINEAIGSSDAEKTFDILITAPNGNKAPIHITRYPNSGKIHATYTNDKGKDVPFDAQGGNGFYGNTADLTRYVKKLISDAKGK